MLEIERKFLTCNDRWRTTNPSSLRQGYLCLDPQRTVRVRIEDDHAVLTIKGISKGATRAEYEYPIPVEHAQTMLDTLCVRPLIEKHRHVVEYEGKRWEIDEFFGDNLGLVVAEIELTDEHEQFETPAWVGEEVTHDARYFNSNLIKHPYSDWNSQAPVGEKNDRAVRPKITHLQSFKVQGSDLPLPPGVTITRCENLTREAYLGLYNGVGGSYDWTDRNQLPANELAEILDASDVIIHRLDVDGQPAGFSELDGRIANEIQLAYFGLFPEQIGKGLGWWFLNWTLAYAWSQSPTRVWLHTCTADHPRALPTYLKAGFKEYTP